MPTEFGKKEETGFKGSETRGPALHIQATTGLCKDRCARRHHADVENMASKSTWQTQRALPRNNESIKMPLENTSSKI